MRTKEVKETCHLILKVNRQWDDAADVIGEVHQILGRGSAPHGSLPLSSVPPFLMPSIHPTATQSSSLLDPSHFPQIVKSTDQSVHVELRFEPINTPTILRLVRSPNAGANVLFVGTTRNSFDRRPVSRLSYTAYPALALKSFLSIGQSVQERHGLEKVCLIHRLGEVPVEEESIAVAVSAGHRGPAWRGAEEALEKCKERVEIWKMEVFGDEEGGGEWRANKDRDQEGRVKQANGEKKKEKKEEEEEEEKKEADQDDYWRQLGLAS